MRIPMLPHVVITGLTVALSACGGGGGGGDSLGGSDPVDTTTNTTSTGTITGFGSIFVNGVEYELGPQADIRIDGQRGSEDALKLGMVVTVNGKVDASGTSGFADAVSYDRELEGPIAEDPVADTEGTTKTFPVLGTTVLAENNGTVFEAEDGSKYGFDALAKGDVVEVSGFVDDADILHATRIELQTEVDAQPEVEVEGAVSDFVSIGEFMVNGQSVDASSATFEPAGLVSSLADGFVVEVEGQLQEDGLILASEVERQKEGRERGDDEADDSGEQDYESVEGLITAFNGIDDFEVGGQPVDASDATLEPSTLVLDTGVRVEVEGPVADGVIQAEEVEGRGGDVEVEGPIAEAPELGPDGLRKTFPVLGTTVVVEKNQTLFEGDGPDSDFGFDTISKGDVVEVKGYRDSEDRLLATQIELRSEDDDEDQDEVKLKGEVTDFNGSDTFSIGEQTVWFDPTGMQTDLTELPDGISDGLYVEVEGTLDASDVLQATEIEAEDSQDEEDGEEEADSGDDEEEGEEEEADAEDGDDDEEDGDSDDAEEEEDDEDEEDDDEEEDET